MKTLIRVIFATWHRKETRVACNLFLSFLLYGCISFDIPNMMDSDSQHSEESIWDSVTSEADNTKATTYTDESDHNDYNHDDDHGTNTHMYDNVDSITKQNTDFDPDSDSDSSITEEVRTDSDVDVDSDSHPVQNPDNDSEGFITEEEKTETDADADTDTLLVQDPDNGSNLASDGDTSTAFNSDTTVLPDSDIVTNTEIDLIKSDFGIDIYTGGFNSRPIVVPTLSETGGEGNVTASGNVEDPIPSVGGACNYGNTDVYNYAVINVNHEANDGLGQWNNGRICGECVRVSLLTATGTKSLVARIMDRCADDLCGIQLGGQPAYKLMGDFPGIYIGSWTFVPCDEGKGVSDGPPAIFVKEGADAWWSLIQIRNAPAAVITIEWRAASGVSGVFEYSNQSENFFAVPTEVLQMSGNITLTLYFNFDIVIKHTLAGKELAVANALIELPFP